MMTLFKKKKTIPAPQTPRQLLESILVAVALELKDKVKTSLLFKRATSVLEHGSEDRACEMLIELLALNWQRSDLTPEDEEGLCKILETLLAYRVAGRHEGMQ